MKSFSIGAATRLSLSPLAAGLIILGTLSQAADAQGIMGNNLVVNGNAEAGAAGVNVPPGWTGTAGVNVGSYGVTGSYLLTESAPPDHGFQYFASTGSNPVIVQKIDVSSGASGDRCRQCQIHSVGLSGIPGAFGLRRICPGGGSI